MAQRIFRSKLVTGQCWLALVSNQPDANHLGRDTVTIIIHSTFTCRQTCHRRYTWMYWLIRPNDGKRGLMWCHEVRCSSTDVITQIHNVKIWNKKIYFLLETIGHYIGHINMLYSPCARCLRSNNHCLLLVLVWYQQWHGTIWVQYLSRKEVSNSLDEPRSSSWRSWQIVNWEQLRTKEAIPFWNSFIKRPA